MVERAGFEPPRPRSGARIKPSLVQLELENGGEGWIWTSERLRGQIYSLLPLTTRPPLHIWNSAPLTWERHSTKNSSSLIRIANRGSREFVYRSSWDPRALWAQGWWSQNNADPSRYKKAKANGAGEGNRTLTASLEGWNSTVELHPRKTLTTLRRFSRLRSKTTRPSDCVALLLITFFLKTAIKAVFLTEKPVELHPHEVKTSAPF